MKTCTMCGETKSIDEFYKHRRMPDGRQSCCKVCSRAMVDKYRAENKEVCNERVLRWQAENPDKVRECAARRYRENKDRIREVQAKYRRENPEKVKEISAKSRAKKLEEMPGYERSMDALKRAKAKGAVIGDIEALHAVYNRAKTDDVVVCRDCGEEIPIEDRNVIHIVPILEGGAHSAENLGICCTDCLYSADRAETSYYERNREKCLELTRRWREENKEKAREKDKCWRRNNKDKIRERNAHLRATDINFRLKESLRARLRRAIHGGWKSGSAVRDLGCTIDELKAHLESQFEPGMSWDNWAFDGWHIDHIVPLASFDLTDRAQFKKACHYTNLQPLWAEENMKKGASVV
jgi:hypothetical protein